MNGDQFLSTPSPCHNVKAGVGWPFCFKKEVPRNVCAGAGRTGRPNWLASRALRLRCVVWSSNCSYLLPLPTNCLAATSRSPQFELNVHRSYGAVVLQGRRLDLKKNLTFRIHIFGGFWLCSVPTKIPTKTSHLHHIETLNVANDPCMKY